MTKLKTTLATAALKAATAIANDPATGATEKDVPAMAAQLEKSVTPIVMHATNAEPWYQSRVTWGAIMAVVAPIVGQILGRQFDAEDQQLAVTIAIGAIGAVGGIVSLYGRWVAKKPIGQ